MGIALGIHELGILLPVKAQPGSRKNEVRGEQDGALKVCVTQIAEKGKANKAIAPLIAKSLGLRKSQVELLAGETSSKKTYLVRDIDMETLRERLEPFVAPE